jgi:hypothetical protein
MAADPETLGYLKYAGDAVPPGVLDPGKAGLALLGLSEAIRYFNDRQTPSLSGVEYEIPVRIDAHSWEAVVLAGVGAFGLAYLATAGKMLATRDFKDMGLREILLKSLQALRHLIRLAKHMKRLRGWVFESLRWRKNNTEVGIPNKEGKYEYFPAEFIEWYSTIPPGFLTKMAIVIEKERSLSIGVLEDGVIVEEKITVREKALFVVGVEGEDEDEYLFPELVHGQKVVLEGVLTRGNASTNSFGLAYNGHILNCTPSTGSVVKYKSALFLRCRVSGIVSRMHGDRKVVERRPTILVERVRPLEKDKQRQLF